MDCTISYVDPASPIWQLVDEFLNVIFDQCYIAIRTYERSNRMCFLTLRDGLSIACEQFMFRVTVHQGFLLCDEVGQVSNAFNPSDVRTCVTF